MCLGERLTLYPIVSGGVCVCGGGEGHSVYIPYYPKRRVKFRTCSLILAH